MLSDRVVVMSRGRVEQIGTPMDIYERPGTRFVAEFMGRPNILEGRVVALEAASAVIKIGALCIAVESAACRVGNRVAVVIRPERFRLLPESSGGTLGRVTGKIERVAYLGAARSYRVVLDDGTVMEVNEPNTGDSLVPRRAPGDRVTLDIPPHACFLLDQSGS
jgi:ABC-type Fe3+/spermidine/putrescine transport system ATPase subunit